VFKFWPIIVRWNTHSSFFWEKSGYENQTEKHSDWRKFNTEVIHAELNIIWGKTLSRGTLNHRSIARCCTHYGTTNKTNVIDRNMNTDTNCHYSVHSICTSETCNEIQIQNFNTTVIGMRQASAQKTEWVSLAVKRLYILYPHNIKTRKVSLRSVCMNVDMASGGCSVRLHWMVPCKMSIEQCSLQYQFSKVGSEHMSSSNKWLGAPTSELPVVIHLCLPICSPPLSSQSSLTWRHTETKKECYNHFKHNSFIKIPTRCNLFCLFG